MGQKVLDVRGTVAPSFQRKRFKFRNQQILETPNIKADKRYLSLIQTLTLSQLAIRYNTFYVLHATLYIISQAFSPYVHFTKKSLI